MKKNIAASLIAIGLLIALNACHSKPTHENNTTTTSPAMSAMYTCPMDTDVHSDKPGKCPKCGMELEK